MLVVEVVGGLVENEDRRVLQQQLGQQHLGALAAAELGDVAVEADLAEAEAVGHLFDFGVDDVKAAVLQQVLDIADILHHRLEVVRRGRSHFIVEGQHLGLQLVHALEGVAQDVADGPALAQAGLLFQVANRHPARPFDPPGVRLQLAGDDVEEGRLSLAVGADEADMLAPEQPEGGAVQDGPGPETVGYVLYSQYAHTCSCVLFFCKMPYYCSKGRPPLSKIISAATRQEGRYKGNVKFTH